MHRIALPTLALSSFLFACSEASAAVQDVGIDQAALEKLSGEIQREVAGLRGESFDGPVAVDVADADEFRAYMLAQIEKTETPESIAADEEVAKLTGMLPPDYAFLDEMLSLIESQVGGFYDPTSKRFYLMEGFSGDLAKVILAHELTHALDDQLFDLAGGIAARKGNSDAQWAYHAVAEGSGTELMTRWTMKHIDELDKASMVEMATMGMDELKEAPPYLWKPLIGAYSQGASFLAKAPEGTSASAAVRLAFEDPPRSSEQVLHPEKYWDADEHDEPVAVSFEGLPTDAGWMVLDEDTLGELGLALFIEPLDQRAGATMLSAMAPRLTWKAAKGWGGDRYVLLGRGEQDRLLVMATTWDREKDAREFEQAVGEISSAIATGPAQEWRVEMEGDRVLVLFARGAGAELLDAAPGWVRHAGAPAEGDAR